MNRISLFLLILSPFLKMVTAEQADSTKTVDTLLFPKSSKIVHSADSIDIYSTLLISSEPSGAVVILDDSIRGVSPVSISGVDTGMHSITLKKKGFYLKKIELRIDSAQKKELQFALQQPSKLFIITEPSGATLYINQKSVGNSPFSNEQIKPGEYSISAEMKNYQSINQTLVIESNSTDTLRLILKHTTAYLDSIKVSEINEKKRYKLFTGIFAGTAFAIFGLVLLILESKE